MLHRFLVILFLALTCSACATKLEQLKATQPVKSPFHATLAREYMEFAQSEADQYDWLDSAYFAEKGLLAARGGNVEPEQIEDWHVAKGNRPTFIQARQYLMTALEKDIKEAYPEDTAKALFLFDCWIEQQEEGWQRKDIQSCREDFYSKLDALFAEVTKQEEKMLEAARKEQEPALPPVQLNYMIFFGFDKAAVDMQSRLIIDRIVKGVKNLKTYEIVLNGHTDRSGKEDYNLKLSKRRAEAVKAKLVAAGIPKDSIKVFAFGETDPAVPTADGVKNANNRRVEITIGQ